MSYDLNFEYEQSLAALSGNDFQVEVTTRLQGLIIDLQPIPASPYGDAGIDGISHGGQRAYCCYGPQQNVFKQNKDIERAITQKFKEDLRRIFELDLERNKLKHCENVEISTILPDGQKIQHIELLVNWFQSHRILNPILTAVTEYASASKCRYVEKTVSVKISGPKELANR